MRRCVVVCVLVSVVLEVIGAGVSTTTGAGAGVSTMTGAGAGVSTTTGAGVVSTVVVVTTGAGDVVTTTVDSAGFGTMLTLVFRPVAEALPALPTELLV
jgi:hypothetical protein